MKKFILVLVMCFITTAAFASAVMRKEDLAKTHQGVLIPDNPAWSGAKYEGKGNLFTVDLYGANRNYLREVRVRYGTVFFDGKWQTGSIVEVVTGDWGEAAYKGLPEAYQATVNPVKSSLNSRAIIELQQSGIIINPKSVWRAWVSPGQVANIKLTGYPLEPNWQIGLLSVSTDVGYAAQAITIIDGWKPASLKKGNVTTVTSNDGKKYSQLIYQK